LIHVQKIAEAAYERANNDMKPKLGDTVVLMGVPPSLNDDLPADDQQAIGEVIGKPIVLKEYDAAGRAGIEGNCIAFT
jgi:hypothetical protein